MAKRIFTHTGRIVKSSAAAMGNDHDVELYETKRHWVTHTGRKYKKESGWPVGTTWAHFTLDIASIKLIPPWSSPNS